MRIVMGALALMVAACGAQNQSNEKEPADQFFTALNAHCGKSYEGAVVSDDPQDEDWRAERMVIEFRECSDDEIRIPLHVGENRSRTWVVTRTEDGLRLKHDHRHEDGSEDAVTQYGGDSGDVTASRAEFPVDQFSIDLFNREDLTASVTNVWAMEIGGDQFAYELSREGRFFRAEFDLTMPAAPPPPPWGAE